jgi:hypothetical protein
MSSLLIHEVLKNASKLKTREERIEYLQKNQTVALKDIFRINFDEDIVSLLPAGEPPYQADDAPEGYQYTTLNKEYTKFKFFFKGPVALDTVAPKRESMFLKLIESLHSGEAKVLIQAKDKRLKVAGITKKLVSDAFPGLIKV